MLKYTSNSCYSDTLLTILFKSLSPFWRDNILNHVYSPKDFQKLDCKDHIKSPAEVFDYSNRIKGELVFIYANLRKQVDITCSTIRPVFNECLGELIVSGKWVTYAPDLIYGLLTDLYPRLKLTSIYDFIDSNGVLRSSSGLVPLFTMSEFIQISNAKKVKWESLNDD